jgi:hypothetical protein
LCFGEWNYFHPSYGKRVAVFVRNCTQMRTQVLFQLHIVLNVLSIPDFIQGISFNAGYAWMTNVIASLIFNEDSKLNSIVSIYIK